MSKPLNILGQSFCTLKVKAFVQSRSNQLSQRSGGAQLSSSVAPSTHSLMNVTFSAQADAGEGDSWLNRLRVARYRRAMSNGFLTNAVSFSMTELVTTITVSFSSDIHMACWLIFIKIISYSVSFCTNVK